MKTIYIDGNNLTINDVINVARKNALVQLSKEAIEK